MADMIKILVAPGHGVARGEFSATADDKGVVEVPADLAPELIESHGAAAWVEPAPKKAAAK